MSETTTTEAVARAWASIDGKPFDDLEYTDGYLSDAEELLRRSGAAAEIAALKAEVERLRENAQGWVKVCLSQSETLCEHPCGWCRERS